MEAFVLALKTINSDRSNDFFIETFLYDTCSDKLGEHVSTIISRNKYATMIFIYSQSVRCRTQQRYLQKKK